LKRGKRELREGLAENKKKNGSVEAIGTHGVVISVSFQIQTKQRSCASHLPLVFCQLGLLLFLSCFLQLIFRRVWWGDSFIRCNYVPHLCDEKHKRSYFIYIFLLTWIFNINMILLTGNLKSGVKL